MKQGNATSRKNKIANKNAVSKGQQALKALATSGKTSRKTSSSSFLSNILLVVVFAIFLLVSMLPDETETPPTGTARGSVLRTPATRVDDTSFANMQSSYSQIVDADDNDDGPSETKGEDSEDDKEEDSPEKETKDIHVEISNNTLNVSPTNSTNIEEKLPKKKKKDPLEGWIYEPKNVNYFW